jgi:NADPH:quinone reductase-like Zn-dependent oxidoreductase
VSICFTKYGLFGRYEGQIPDVDIILDTVGGEHIRTRLWGLLVNRRGKFVSLGMGDEPLTLMDSFLIGYRGIVRKVISFMFRRPSYHLLAVKPDGDKLEQIAQQHVKYGLSLGHVTRCYQLNENNARLAHKLSEARHTRGKILLQVASLIPQRELFKSQQFLQQYQ